MFRFHVYLGSGDYPLCMADRGDGNYCLLAPENHTLEEAKRRHGGDCYWCKKPLTKDDEDFAYCNKCWADIFKDEPLEDEDEYSEMLDTIDELVAWRNG